MSRNFIRNIFRSKWAMIGISIAVVTGAAGYIWWSSNAWDTYKTRYSEARQLTNDQLAAVFRLDADTKEQRQEKFVRLLKIHNDISTLEKTLCSQHRLVAWQGVLLEYRKREEECKSTRALLRAFNAQLEKTTAYLRHAMQLAIYISEVPSQAETTEADWKGQFDAWRSKCDEIKALSGNGEFDVVKAAATDACEAIAKGWGEVTAAHEAKDKARYNTATQSLAAAYDTLDKISITDTEQLKKHAENLQAAYRQLQ